jgi:uncharacterized metal-binding protein YceD (DUF177 family)
MINEFTRHVPIDKVPAKGHKEKIEANEQERVALARRFDLLTLDKFSANIDVQKASGGSRYHVTGDLTATITQKSAVSGEPITKDLRHDIDAWYVDESHIASFASAKRQKEIIEEGEEHEIRAEADDPEKIQGGVLDIGEVAAQFLGLAIDIYPRGEEEHEGAGDYIEVKPEDAKDNPFAKLAELKKK